MATSQPPDQSRSPANGHLNTITLSPSRRLSVSQRARHTIALGKLQGSSWPKSEGGSRPGTPGGEGSSLLRTTVPTTSSSLPSLSPPEAARPQSLPPPRTKPAKLTTSEEQRPPTAGGSRGRTLTDYLNLPEWHNRDISLNSIAGVINNPMARSGASSKISKSDLPVVPVTTYRKVRASDFDEYLGKISRHFEQYEQTKQHRAEQAIIDAEPIPAPSILLSGSSKEGDGSPAPANSNSAKPPDKAGLQLEDVPRVFYQSELDLTDPDQFRLLCTTLGQVGIVDSPEADSRGRVPLPVLTPEFISRSQDYITQCLDVVEQRLTNEIGQRSGAFFNALSTLQNLHEETDKCVEKIHSLRGMLANVSELHCGTGRSLLRLRQRKQNLLHLQDAIGVLQELRAVLDHITILVQQDDLTGALHLLCDAQVAAAKYRESGATDTPNLTRVRAFKELTSELSATAQSVRLVVQQRFPLVITKRLDQLWRSVTIESVSSVMPFYSDELPRISTLPPSIWTETEAQLDAALTPYLTALRRSGQVESALRGLRDPLINEVTQLLIQLWSSSFPELLGRIGLAKSSSNPVTSPNSADPSVTGVPVDPQPWMAEVTTMTFDRFLEWLFQLFAAFLLVVKYTLVVRDVCVAAMEPNSPGIAELNAMVEALLDLAHVRCAQVVSHRSDQNSQLDLKAFYRLYAVSWAYIYEMEECTTKTCFGIRGTLVAQCKAFLSHFHMERTKQLIMLIESDQWVQKGVPIDFQHMVDKIVASSTRRPESTLLNSKRGSLSTKSEVGGESVTDGDTSSRVSGEGGPPHTSPPESGRVRNVPPLLVLEIDSDTPKESRNRDSVARKKANRASVDSISSLLLSGTPDSWYFDPDLLPVGPNNENGGPAAAPDTHKFLVIRGQNFHVVGCSLMLLKMVIDYIQCSANIQILATDVLHRVIEIFKLFNSRTCQVILGAGAIRSAGLKSITAKHIALASQSLGLVITLLPYVRECLRQTLTTHQEKLLIEFDRILKDYREHQSELHNNLVTIMAERAQFHGKTMQATDWDVKQAGPKDFSPTPNMELLVKETKTLHKVLGRYLSIDILQSIMSQVLRMYSQKLMAQIQEVDITTAQGKQRLLADVQYFIERLSTLDHVEPPNNSLEVLVNNITIGAKPRPPLPSR